MKSTREAREAVLACLRASGPLPVASIAVLTGLNPTDVSSQVLVLKNRGDVVMAGRDGMGRRTWAASRGPARETPEYLEARE